MIHQKVPYKLNSILSALMLYTLCFTSPSIAADAPTDALKTFYQHVAKQECEDALTLRPDYSLQRCEKVSKVHIHKVTTELSDNDNAVLLLELDSFYNKKKSYFFGYVRMAKKKEKWQVIGPFKSKEDYWLDEYVKRYIPGEFKGLPESVKKKKFTPPPAPMFSSKKAPQEEDIIAEKKISAPGDSIDADEFTPQQTEKKESSTKKHSIAKKNTAIKSTKPEADKFLSGGYAIQGNYTSLLTKIRQHFPTDTSASLLLIDKSRRTLYLYNPQNLLLAFFPILSSDNSSFLSGLYKVSLDKPVRSEKYTPLQGGQPILLKRMLLQDNKDNPHFYIRDLFDTDTKNSLKLSPIDNKKLQQLLSTPSMAYIGQ